MTEVVLKGYYDRGKDEQVKEMHVHFMGESFIWFEFLLENGKKVQTMCLRGEI